MILGGDPDGPDAWVTRLFNAVAVILILGLCAFAVYSLKH